MVPPPSPEDIQAAYENTVPACIHVANGIVRIKDKGSDGDASCLPLDGEQVTLSDNTIDVLAEADRENVKRWLDKIGNYLIYEGDWHSLARDRVYSLKRFPLGYKLYVHRTGDRRNPRRDSYLFGSTTDRCRTFRSPEEFALHAKWLAFGRPRDELGRPLCACCYCSRMPQGEISAMLKEKIDHLHTSRTVSNRGHGRGHGREKSHASEAPVIAKDYTQLNRGEGVSIWKESEQRTAFS